MTFEELSIFFKKMYVHCLRRICKNILYRAPRMSFDHQTLQASIIFVHNHFHKVSDFFEMFCYVFLRECSVGAPSWGSATTFPYGVITVFIIV